MSNRAVDAPELSDCAPDSIDNKQNAANPSKPCPDGSVTPVKEVYQQ